MRKATPLYNYIFFTNVLRLLDERHMTKKELSDRSGVSISFLSDLTTGKANPSLKVMQDIAKALDAPLPLLLESTDLDKDTLDALAGGKAPQSLPVSSEWRRCYRRIRHSSSRSGARPPARSSGGRTPRKKAGKGRGKELSQQKPALFSR